MSRWSDSETPLWVHLLFGFAVVAIFVKTLATVAGWAADARRSPDAPAVRVIPMPPTNEDLPPHGRRGNE